MKKQQLLPLVIILALIGGAAWWWMSSRANNRWPITNDPPGGSRLVALGDSLTHGYGVNPSESFPAVLSRRLGTPILNKGVNGHTTAQGLARLETDVLAQDPRVVIVCLGGNDILRRVPIEQTFDNLRTIVTRIHAETDALVILVGIEGDGMIYRGDYGTRFRELARETGCVYVPNILKGLMGRSDLMLDTTHPNATGYERFVERLDREAGAWLRR